MKQRNPLLPKTYFLDNFIGGLKSTLKPFIRAFSPNDMAATIKFAKLKEQSDEAEKRFNKNVGCGFPKKTFGINDKLGYSGNTSNVGVSRTFQG